MFIYINMNCIRNKIKKLICEDTNFIENLTSYQLPLNEIDENYYKKYFINLKETFEKEENKITSFDTIISSIHTYKIIKNILDTYGLSYIHPAWIFIHQDFFNIKKNNDTIEINGITTNIVNIYYTLITNSAIKKCFINKNSPFLVAFPEFKELYKYLFFPRIEEIKINSQNNLYLIYNFNYIMNDLTFEINKIKNTDIEENQIRIGKFYYEHYSIIVMCYENEDFSILLPQILFRLMYNIYITNEDAVFVFNDINTELKLNISLISYELKNDIDNNTLTLKKFVKYCKLVNIDIPDNYIETIKNSVFEEQIKMYFYNYKELNEDTILTYVGCNMLMIKFTEKKYNSFCWDFFSMKRGDLLHDFYIEFTRFDLNNCIYKYTQTESFITKKNQDLTKCQNVLKLNFQ